MGQAVRTAETGRLVERVWAPQEGPQKALLGCPIEEIFFGGARGGGKTDGSLGDWMVHAGRYGRAARGIFFRRRSKDLEDVIRRALELFPKLGAKFRDAPKNRFDWPNGAQLKFRQLWDEKDAAHYQGHAYTRVYVEEITQWASDQAVRLLWGAMRSPEGVPVGMRLTGNPGGPGHEWVKRRYVSPAPGGYVPILDTETGRSRVFIPSRLDDNRILMEGDPGYEKGLAAVGNPALVKAWRFGLWDIVAGGYFDDLWNPDRHILDPFVPGPAWQFRASFDWGSAKPASLGLWGISPGVELQGRWIAPGSFVRFGEWYTVAFKANGDWTPNEGARIKNADLGAGIAKRLAGRSFSGNVADPSIFTEDGGPSIYRQMRDGAEALGGIEFGKADNSRVAGWMRMREMFENALAARAEGPGLYTTENCVHFIRTCPVLQRDPSNPDDVDTEGEDHAADDARYAVMSTGMGEVVSEEFFV